MKKGKIVPVYVLKFQIKYRISDYVKKEIELLGISFLKDKEYNFVYDNNIDSSYTYTEKLWYIMRKEYSQNLHNIQKGKITIEKLLKFHFINPQNISPYIFSHPTMSSKVSYTKDCSISFANDEDRKEFEKLLMKFSKKKSIEKFLNND